MYLEYVGKTTSQDLVIIINILSMQVTYCSIIVEVNWATQDINGDCINIWLADLLYKLLFLDLWLIE